MHYENFTINGHALPVFNNLFRTKISWQACRKEFLLIDPVRKI